MFGSVVSLSLLQPLDRWSLNLIGSPKARFTVGLTRRRRFAAPRASARGAFVRLVFFAFSLRLVLYVHFSVPLIVIGFFGCAVWCSLGIFRLCVLPPCFSVAQIGSG